MTHGHCPKCNSTHYTPDSRVGGAGRNECRNCGHIGPVRDFHIDIPIEVKTREPGPGRVFYTEEPPAAVLMPNGDFNDMRRLHTDTPPAPIRQYKDN